MFCGPCLWATSLIPCVLQREGDLLRHAKLFLETQAHMLTAQHAMRQADPAMAWDAVVCLRDIHRDRRELWRIWPDNEMIEQVEESRRKALAAFEQVQIAWQTERQRMEAGGCNVAHVNARVEIPSSRLRDIDAEKARLTSPLQNMQRELEACRSEIEILAALELQPAPPLQSLQSNDLVPIEVLHAIAFVGGSHLAPVEQ